jgi:cytochrome b subunit of formate dehydrogenase
MGVAALICWFITALAGLYLVAVWLIENDVGEQGTVASRLPGPVILAHVLLALTGLVVWVIHLLSGSASWGWAAVGILAAIATLGLTMFTRWIPVHVAYVAAEAKAGRSREFDFPAERAFPLPVVVGHGLLAVTTVTLVLLANLGVGGG